MNKKIEDIESLILSINMLEKKASDINESIKVHSKSLNHNRINNKIENKDTSYSEFLHDNKSLEIKDNINNLNIIELENKLKKELLELKKQTEDSKFSTLRYGDYICIPNYFSYRDEFY